MKVDLLAQKGKIVRHFKGDYYLVMDVATHCETGDRFVVYKALYEENEVYIRPFEDFVGKVDENKYPQFASQFRFTEVTLPSIKKINEAEMAKRAQMAQQAEANTSTEGMNNDERIQNI